MTTQQHVPESTDHAHAPASDAPTHHTPVPAEPAEHAHSTGPLVVNRRRALAAAGLGAGALTLAACGSSSTPAAAPASTAPAATAPAAGSAPAAAGSGGAAGSNALVALSKVPVGGAVAATDANGKPIIVAQPTAGKVVAFSAICTHMGCPVKVAGAQLDCPCHGSKYNALTGAVINGPAPKPLPAVPVAISGDNVVAS